MVDRQLQEFTLPASINELLGRMKELEGQLESEFAARRTEFQYRLVEGRIRFEKEVAEQHRSLKTKLSAYIKGAPPLVLLTAPFIYAVIVPFVLLDIFVSIYQAVRFPVYGIPMVRRRDYIVFDRHHLAYLNGIEKLNCAYCSYGNGLIAFVREVASRTEQYWCPIKHAQRIAGMHPRYPNFIEYGDAEGYQQKLEMLRGRLLKDSSASSP